MSKSDLKARPIFHHLKDSIKAHLTVVMAALATGRTIEEKTGITTRRFVKRLRTVRVGGRRYYGKEYPAKAALPEDVDKLLRKLKRTH